MTTNSLQRLKDLAVSDTGFIFDPATGSTFSVNASGMTILSRIKEGEGHDEITAALEDGFEVQEEDLRRDVDEFVLLLRNEGLLPEDFDL